MKCKVCGERFGDTQIARGYDDYPYGGMSMQVCTHGVCPVCGAEDLQEEAYCLQCGEEVVCADMVDGFCRFCAEELEQTLEWVMSMLTPAQLHWMSQHPDWMKRGECTC